MGEAIQNNQGSWARAAARVVGLWFVIFIGSWVIWLATEFFLRHSIVTMFFVLASVLLAPAYGVAEYRAARRRNERKSARGAKVAAIVVLAINSTVLVLMLLLAEAVKHLR